ncbi:hypothetical protein L228DRAFT_247088 [Xylona heveae TC161]|uniref:Cyclase n=1 Tax=Xylona heveae (strain CBS 132557 / TC161) TaxID=1328760 RepID=A0A165GX73_XYLHT|nr:hypothetical protein L228DRAFT_247088 [Xylona heveae TC161]KZF22714.1 hypothetical protein L228DRAFT_247088 [Xylona heveae TC161]
MSKSEVVIPKFSELPLREGDPPYSAWGLYGKDDQLGTLNRLADRIVRDAARKEIQTGKRISLNWPLNAQRDHLLFGRQAFHQRIFQLSSYIVNDDTWSFNSQGSSQWDGLRHFGYQKEQKFYNGVTLEDIHNEKDTGVNGVHAWSEQGIVGRGILLDFHRWRTLNGIDFDPFESQSIPLEYLKATAKAQGTEINFGDILIVRTGYIEKTRSASREQLQARAEIELPPSGGVEQSEEMLEWIWSNFSAVAGDHPAFECWPSQKPWMLHEVLLAGWGCPIGELFDLDKLAEHCEKTGRWSFFVTSEVCNVPGGVASPPNILAIF